MIQKTLPVFDLSEHPVDMRSKKQQRHLAHSCDDYLSVWMSHRRVEPHLGENLHHITTEQEGGTEITCILAGGGLSVAQL